MAKTKKAASPAQAQVSTKFWFWAIILSWFPGFNLLIFLPLLIFSKNPTKRNFYKANVWLCILPVMLSIVAIFVIFLTKGEAEFSKIWKQMQATETPDDEPILVKPKVLLPNR